MRVLFYEPNHTGHHFAYLANMLPGFLDLPIKVGLCTTQRALESTEYQKSLKPLESLFEHVPLCRPLLRGKPFRNALRRLSDLRLAIESWNPDHVCISYVDGLWQMFALRSLVPRFNMLRNVTSEAWAFRGAFSYPSTHRRIDIFKQAMWRRLLKQGVFSKVHLHDELLYQFSDSVSGRKSDIALAPDPIDIQPSPTQSESRTQLGIAQDGFLFGCLGVADHRKGVPQSIEAIASLGKPPIARLLIAGPHSESVRQLMAEPRYQKLVDDKTIVSIDRFLSQEEMRLTASACDVVLAPYHNHSGRSSIILWAAAAGKPVIAADYGCVRHVVTTNNLGITCDVANVKEFARVMNASINNVWTDQDAARVRQYAQWHRAENYQALSSAFVRQLLAKSVVPTA